MLESALARPLNRPAYGDPDIAELAAVYALGIAQNHPFFDGNKRTAFAALFVFLGLNGMAFDPSEMDATLTILQMAAGEIDDAAFTDWVSRHTRPIP